MKVSSIRSLEELKSVLEDRTEKEPDPVYWVFSDISDGKWANLTVIAPGFKGNEYPKTFGHYHGVNVDETYHLIEGEGILQLQKKSNQDDQIEEVILIKAKPGDEIVITQEWGHSWSNIGELPLLTFDNWREGHSTTDYDLIKSAQGMAYYLFNDDGSIKLEPNKNYQSLPEPIWMSAEEFKEKR